MKKNVLVFLYWIILAFVVGFFMTLGTKVAYNFFPKDPIQYERTAPQLDNTEKKEGALL